MRGGSRNAGRKMPSNTSGLAGIRFGYAKGIPQVYVAYGDRRSSFSIEANGAKEALQLAILRRFSVGLPVDSLSTALRAFKEWNT